MVKELKMIIDLQKEFEEAESVSTHVDPFKKNSIRVVRLYCYPDHFRGNIAFEKGPTSGEHSFNCSSFKELITQVQNFIDNLGE
jgi:hypothetical protein